MLVMVALNGQQYTTTSVSYSYLVVMAQVRCPEESTVQGRHRQGWHRLWCCRKGHHTKEMACRQTERQGRHHLFFVVGA